VVLVVYAIYLCRSNVCLFVFVFAGVRCMICMGLLCSDVCSEYHLVMIGRVEGRRFVGVVMGLVFDGKLVSICLFMNSYLGLCSLVSISLICIPFCYFAYVIIFNHIYHFALLFNV
jgi:hypothetical protein